MKDSKAAGDCQVLKDITGTGAKEFRLCNDLTPTKI